MKPRLGLGKALWKKLCGVFPAGRDRALYRAVDRGLVWVGWAPEVMDGAGKILHISDTPTCMYGYLARLLRRINPSVIVHTGDLADDIKLEIYPGDAERYRIAARRLVNILEAPRRKVILALGNHDKRDLLPSLSSQCIICDNVMDITLFGEEFRISHYIGFILDKPARYNLFGHSPEPASFTDEKDRLFLNGIEKMRLIDPEARMIFLNYPSGTDNARLTRRKRMAR
ncbi:MAG: metallophosphoesterase [Synergistaceae bacterium]|jgi:predicted phosphodiesterase|nr:metallophosphoesterase [Synergistaceae bacterium]